MANLSEERRVRILSFLDTLRQANRDNVVELRAINEIEEALNEKKYGLVWEEHTENVDELANENVLMFEELGFRKVISKTEEKFNFLLEGDNLHSLKLLEKTHRGRIDLIYIDPPYNTQNKDFKYDDTYIDPNDEYVHSKWLSFMCRRLKIARTLLSKTGVIFISIDDREAAQLKLLCDEVFGESNFVNSISVKMSEASGVKMTHVDKRLVKIGETILVYKKESLLLNPIKISKRKWDKEYNKVLLNFSEEDKAALDRLAVNEALLSESDILNYADAILSKCEISSIAEVMKSERISKDDIDEWCFKNAYRIFRTAASSSVLKLAEEKKKINSNILFSVLSSRDRKLYFVKSDYNETSKSPRVQILFASDYLEEYLGDYWSDINTTGLEAEGGISLKNGKKPLALIRRIISMPATPVNIVLDFFAGSGTTGHAVVDLNKQDGGNRQYILCTNNENSICEEITYQRLLNIQKELPHNLKYLKTGLIRRTVDEPMTDELLSCIVPLIELEYSCDLDLSSIKVFLTEEDFDEYMNHTKELKLKKTFLASDILLSSEQSKRLNDVGCEIIRIPEYYYRDELIETGDI